jgi:hypothetical protein
MNLRSPARGATPAPRFADHTESAPKVTKNALGKRSGLSPISPQRTAATVFARLPVVPEIQRRYRHNHLPVSASDTLDPWF